jgi:hypothetical protein
MNELEQAVHCCVKRFGLLHQALGQKTKQPKWAACAKNFKPI